MTRTARAAYPRAINRDRSESRSGLDASMRKHGAGQHNWGSFADERRMETEAMDDEGLGHEEEDHSDDRSVSSDSSLPRSKPELERAISQSSMTDEDMEKARKIRKNAFKKSNGIDLSAIARTSAAVSGSPPSPTATRR